MICLGHRFLRALTLTAFLTTLGIVAMPAERSFAAKTSASGVMADRFSVSTMFTNNMVLQRNGHDPIWGWAQPGDMITVHFSGHTAVTRTGPSGRWQIDLSPLSASSAPRTMTISDGKQAIALHDVVVGEVWLCSGQSNMQYPMAGWFHRTNLARALAAANHPTIRLYHVPMIESMFAGRPHLTAPAKWQRCTPRTAAGFSAVAYFFGNALRKRLHVPIGLIESDWGGTSIEAWTPAVGFFKYSHLTKTQRWLKPAMASEADLAGAPAGVHRTGLINSPHGYPYDFQSTWLPDPHQNPTTLFNGMINPLIPFAIRGVIWYQGENNVLSHDTHYYSQLKALILGWRHVWNQGPFPFYIVQIAPFNYGQNWCGPHGTDAPYEPLIWQAEDKAATHVAHVGIVGTMDIGPGAKQIFDHHVNNIHPANKQAVGYRLALLALAKTYGFKNLPCEGPTFKSASLQNHRIVIHFAHSDGGLISRNGKPLNWFQIAGANGKFLPANARIVGRTVVVVTNAIQHPKAVRFAFNCVAVPNLANRAGLPAMPFEVHLKH